MKKVSSVVALGVCETPCVIQKHVFEDKSLAWFNEARANEAAGFLIANALWDICECVYYEIENISM